MLNASHTMAIHWCTQNNALMPYSLQSSTTISKDTLHHTVRVLLHCTQTHTVTNTTNFKEKHFILQVEAFSLCPPKKSYLLFLGAKCEQQISAQNFMVLFCEC